MCVSASIFVATAFSKLKLVPFLVCRSLKRLSSSLSILNVFIFLKLCASLQTINYTLKLTGAVNVSRWAWHVASTDHRDKPTQQKNVHCICMQLGFMFVRLLEHQLNDAICCCSDAININFNTMYGQFMRFFTPFPSLFFLFASVTVSYTSHFVAKQWIAHTVSKSLIFHWCHRLVHYTSVSTHRHPTYFLAYYQNENKLPTHKKCLANKSK